MYIFVKHTLAVLKLGAHVGCQMTIADVGEHVACIIKTDLGDFDAQASMRILPGGRSQPSSCKWVSPESVGTRCHGSSRYGTCAQGQTAPSPCGATPTTAPALPRGWSWAAAGPRAPPPPPARARPLRGPALTSERRWRANRLVPRRPACSFLSLGNTDLVHGSADN